MLLAAVCDSCGGDDWWLWLYCGYGNHYDRDGGGDKGIGGVGSGHCGSGRSGSFESDCVGLVVVVVVVVVVSGE